MPNTALKELEIYKQNWPRVSKRFEKLNKAIDMYLKVCPVDMGIFLRIKDIEAREKWDNLSLADRKYTAKGIKPTNITEFARRAKTRIDKKPLA
jgi:hypothetical protein